MKWPGVDLRQELALFDSLPFLVINLHQLAVYASFHGHGIERGDRTEPGEIDADIPLLGRNGGNGDALGSLGGFRSGRTARFAQAAVDHHPTRAATSSQIHQRLGLLPFRFRPNPSLFSDVIVITL